MVDKHLSKQEKAIRKQASEYAVRLFSGDLSEQESIAISKWSNRSELHQSELQAMMEIYSVSGQLYQTATIREKNVWLKRAAIAASIIAFSLWTISLSDIDRPIGSKRTVEEVVINDSKNQYQTDIGEISKVVLSDNTIITLNTNTNIEVAYTKKQRYIRLLHGEAFFEVTKDPSRPFKIDTGIRIVEVIGTKFNLKKINSELEVAVTEGLVSVQQHPQDKSSSTTISEQNLTVKELMKAGSFATFSDTRKIVTQTNERKVNRLQSWRSGVISFDDVTLEEFVSELNRYQKAKIVIADPELNNMRISGVFNSRETNPALEAIAEILPIRVERQENKISIVKKD